MELVWDSGRAVRTGAARRAARTGTGTGGVRLTRRGRVVVALFLLVLAALALAYASPASDAATPPGPAPAVVVLPGESLWSIAARYLPSRDGQAAVERIRRLNGLGGYTIYPGERLLLPRR